MLDTAEFFQHDFQIARQVEQGGTTVITDLMHTELAKLAEALPPPQPTLESRQVLTEQPAGILPPPSRRKAATAMLSGMGATEISHIGLATTSVESELAHIGTAELNLILVADPLIEADTEAVTATLQAIEALHDLQQPDALKKLCPKALFSSGKMILHVMKPVSGGPGIACYRIEEANGRTIAIQIDKTGEVIGDLSSYDSPSSAYLDILHNKRPTVPSTTGMQTVDIAQHTQQIGRGINSSQAIFKPLFTSTSTFQEMAHNTMRSALKSENPWSFHLIASGLTDGPRIYIDKKDEV